ncbi:MAG: type II toxin-antitoxin system HicA family toxin [Trichocoleus desertorum ATA4-8-CV12]|nr:type II toxin-antitoxin system HicA family toxin [Trichocoleus desertorum ATA4-8-CV12]
MHEPLTNRQFSDDGQAAEKLGFEAVRQKGSHVREILREIELSPDEFLRELEGL